MPPRGILVQTGGPTNMTDPIYYPDQLPALPTTGATVSQVQGFEVFTNSNGIASTVRTMDNPPLKFETTLTLTTDAEIADFKGWFLHDLDQGVNSFFITLPPWVGVVKGTYLCRFSAAPEFLEVGCHRRRIQQIGIQIFIFAPKYVGTAPKPNSWGEKDIDMAPITQSLVHRPTSTAGKSIDDFGQGRYMGVYQGPDTYEFQFLYSYDLYQKFIAHWHHNLADGVGRVGLYLVPGAGAGLQLVNFTPTKPWRASIHAGDVIVTLTGQVQNPPGPDLYENLAGLQGDWQTWRGDVAKIWTNLRGVR